MAAATARGDAGGIAARGSRAARGAAARRRAAPGPRRARAEGHGAALLPAAGGTLAPLTGLVAGALHVATGPDHLLALAPIALVSRADAVRAGMLWGLGHGAGAAILAVGAATARLLAGALVPGEVAARTTVELMSIGAEVMVGVLLLAVGARAIKQAVDGIETIDLDAEHTHTHGHGHSHSHSHAHSHSHSGGGSGDVDALQWQGFGVGVMHGAAGGSHLLGVGPALALPPVATVIYLLAYLLSVTVAMAGMGAIIGRVAEVTDKTGLTDGFRWVLGGTGFFASVLGAQWLAQAVPSASMKLALLF